MLGEAIRQGHPLGFVTLTMRHHRRQPLDLLWQAAAKGWTRAITGKGWVAVEELTEGWVRVWEVTEGRNGWHVHVHLVVVLAVGSTDADLEVVAGGMFGRWSRGLTAAGLSAPLRKGQDWHLATGEQAAEDLATYLAKSVSVIDNLRAEAVRDGIASDLGMELTRSMPGRARDDLKTRPVWALLDDLAETGEAKALHRWHEWERASSGRKQIGWSNGLRKRFAPLLDEATDQAIVDQVLGDESDTLLLWTTYQWRTFIAHPTRAVELLDAAESLGRPGVLALLASWGDVECGVVNGDEIHGSGRLPHQVQPVGADTTGVGAGAHSREAGEHPAPAPSGPLGLLTESAGARCGGLGVQPPGVRFFPPVPVIEVQAEGVESGEQREPWPPGLRG